MERMMKVQEVILKAMSGSLKWLEAARHPAQLHLGEAGAARSRSGEKA